MGTRGVWKVGSGVFRDVCEERLAVICFQMEPYSRCVFVYRNTFTPYSWE